METSQMHRHSPLVCVPSVPAIHLTRSADLAHLRKLGFALLCFLASLRLDD